MVFAPFSDWRARASAPPSSSICGSAASSSPACLLSVVFRKSRIPPSRRLPAWWATSGSSTCRSEQRDSSSASSTRRRGRCKDAKITAHPRPVSPFNWTVFVSDDRGASLRARQSGAERKRKPLPAGRRLHRRIDSPYLPLDQAIWVTRRRYGETDQDLIREAWNAEPLAFYRWFADLPAFDGMSASRPARSSSTCASSRRGATRCRSATAPAATRRARPGACCSGLATCGLNSARKRSASCGWLE